MSKYQFAKEIQKELEVLNKRIDRKIFQRLSYTTEARRHKILLAELNRIYGNYRTGFLGRLSSVFSFRKFV